MHSKDELNSWIGKEVVVGVYLGRLALRLAFGPYLICLLGMPENIRMLQICAFKFLIQCLKQLKGYRSSYLNTYLICWSKISI